jgi:acylphosphatase
MVHYKLVITGKVQGVYYRAYAQKEAEKLGLKGWVRNQSNGSVVAMVQGEKQVVDAFVDWCHKGSPSSVVEQVSIELQETLDYPDFRILL